MAITIVVNGESISYPQTGDTGWSGQATEFAEQTASAFGALGLSSGTTVDIPGTLDVTGATTIDSTLTVAGTTNLNGTANLNGNTNLGNGSSDTIAVTGILNVDSGVLYVDPATNKVGINDTTPSVELDVNGSVSITGNETVGGTLNVTGATTLSSTLAVTGNLSVNGNSTLGDASGDSLTINSNGVSIPNGLNFDSNTLVIDATNNRVGIGVASPSKALDINGQLRVRNGTTTGYALLEYGNSSTDSQNWHVGSEGDGTFRFYNQSFGSGLERLRIDSNGQLNAVVPSGSTLYPGYLCRAWINFNGTGTTGANQTIRGSGNVSSVLKNATGDYTVNIDTDMPDGNYSTPTSCAINATGNAGSQNGDIYVNSQVAGSYRILTANGGTFTDMAVVTSAVFR